MFKIIDFLTYMDIQGHRGCRGLFPENTLIAMEYALQLGVTTLEFDLAITKDGHVLLSHEPYFNSEITTLPNGQWIPPGEDLQYNIYEMTFEETQRYDVGLKPHPRFPKQKKVAATKPLLEEVVTLALKQKKEIRFNIEIKSLPEGDLIYHPSVENFCECVMNKVNQYSIHAQTLIQSFDYRVLEYLHLRYPSQRLSMLSENGKDLTYNLSCLSFKPDVYSPDVDQLTLSDLHLAHEMGIQVIPWTINQIEIMEYWIEKGVDGIITDYPNLYLKKGL